MTGLVCLLPARNAARDLPDYLESAGHFCDAIVALDDGSADRTPEILSAHPLVKMMLQNPVREDYRGWDDSLNRNRLLEAAASLEPEWIISVDADERMHQSDAVALRRFLETDALPGCAYRFQWLQMREVTSQYLPEIIWVPRLFAFEPGQSFPTDRLHFAPVPISIPRSAYVKTTLRIQHLGAMTAELRAARFEKYRQADPESAFWSDYSVILAEPKTAYISFESRQPDLPVLLLESDPDDSKPNFGNTRHGHLARSNEQKSQVEQVGEGSIDELLQGNSVDFAVIAEQDIKLRPEASDAIIAAHRAGHAVVAPVIRAQPESHAAKADILLRYHDQLPGLAPANLTRLPTICSFVVDELRVLKSPTKDSDSSANQQFETKTLFERAGFICRREPSAEIEIVQIDRRLRQVSGDSFARGRLRARRWMSEERTRGRLISPKTLRTWALDHPKKQMREIGLAANQSEPTVMSWLNDSERFVKLGLGFETIGSLIEIFRPKRGKLALLAGRVTGFVMFVFRHGGETCALLVRFDAAAPYARGIWFDSRTLNRLRGGKDGQMTDLFSAREFAAKHCHAPVDGLVEFDPCDRSPIHPSILLTRRLLGESRLLQFEEWSPDNLKSPGFKSTMESRDLALIWWSLITMPRRAISVIDYPEVSDPLSLIEDHFGHGGDTTSKWQAGPRQKRAM